VKLSVLLFARFRELAGRPSVEVEVPAGATLGQVWERVRVDVPALRQEHRPLLACNRSYARTDQIVLEGEEIAAFPPVSGG
jgi:molybdopterin converting factor subunit 1